MLPLPALAVTSWELPGTQNFPISSLALLVFLPAGFQKDSGLVEMYDCWCVLGGWEIKRKPDSVFQPGEGARHTQRIYMHDLGEKDSGVPVVWWSTSTR